jgi:hypothetical protein
MRRILPAFVLVLAFTAPAVAAGKYSVEKKTVEGYTTYHLLDAQQKMDVGIVPEMGDVVYEFKVNGKDVLVPVSSLKEFLARHAVSAGMAFLAPWPNRIDHDYYYFEGKKYLLNDEQGNAASFLQVCRPHGAIPFRRDLRNHLPLERREA